MATADIVKLNPPKGFRVYGGASWSSAEDASGAIWFYGCGDYADGRFGLAALRQVGNGVAELVELPVALPGRGVLSGSTEGFGTGTTEHKEVYRVRIPRFIPKAGAGTGAFSVPVIIPGSDLDARAKAQVALEASQTASKNASDAKRLAEAAKLQAADAQRIASTSTVTIDQVWQKAGDRIQAELNNPGSPLMSVIWQKANDATYAQLVQRGIIKP